MSHLFLNLRYNYQYKGCTYEELDCVQDYTCDCQYFMAGTGETWRCWGAGDSIPQCPSSAPTARYVNEIKMCDPHAPLPKDPNPPPPQCPATYQDASMRGCDGRIKTCNYGYHEFACNGATRCVPSHTCECQGHWVCYGLTHYCKTPGVVSPNAPCTP
jgi:hypothetical protein